MPRFISLLSIICWLLPAFQGCQPSVSLPAAVPPLAPTPVEHSEQPQPASEPRAQIVRLASSSASPPAAAPESLAARINSGTLALLPKQAGKPVVTSNQLFKMYRPTEGSVWAKGWTRELDWSGVAWDRPQTVTLISPRHVIMAGHYKRKGRHSLNFHNKAGYTVARKLLATRDIKGKDIAVSILDREVPKSVTHYPVLAPSEDYPASLLGAYALITNKKRMVHIHQIHSINYQRGGVLFRRATGLPEGYYEPLIKGDSGNPSFVLIRGQLVLIETHTGGGAGTGPFFGSPKNVAAINAAMRELSELKSAPVYQLKTVKP